MSMHDTSVHAHACNLQWFYCYCTVSYGSLVPDLPSEKGPLPQSLSPEVIKAANIARELLLIAV